MSESALPEYFGIQLTASDVTGFAGATTAFTIVVGVHELLFANSQQTVDITEGHNVNFPDLKSQLHLDGKPIADQDLKQATADIPSWITFNNRTLEFRGTPPKGTRSSTISVSVIDIYGDIASTTVLLQTTSNLFRGRIDDLNATIGQDFTYTFSQTLWTDPEIQVSVDLGNASPWLRYMGQTMKLQGHVPSDVKPQEFMLNVTASKGATTESQTSVLTVRKAAEQLGHQTSSILSSSTDATSSPGSTSTPKPQSTAAVTSNGGSLSKGAITAAVLIPIVVLCAVLMLCLCYIRRRRTERGVKRSKEVTKQDISGPLPTKEPPTHHHTLTASRPPRIHSGILQKSTDKLNDHFGLSRRSSDEESGLREMVPVTTTDRYSKLLSDWETSFPRPQTKVGFTIARDDWATAHQNTLESPRRRPASRYLYRSSRDISQARRDSRRSRRQSDMSMMSSGLTNKKRQSGIGHGKSASIPTSPGPLNKRSSVVVGGHGKSDRGPPNHGEIRPSIYSSAFEDEGSESDYSDDNDENIHASPAIPRRSRNRLTTSSFGFGPLQEVSQAQVPIPGPSIRAVTPLDRRLSVLSARQRYLERRAKARNSTTPFFSAGSLSSRSRSRHFSHHTHSLLLSPLTSRAPSSVYPSDTYTTNNTNTLSIFQNQNQDQHQDLERGLVLEEEDQDPGTNRTTRSYSKSSSLDPPLRPRPRSGKHSPRKSFGLGARAIARAIQRSPVRGIRALSPSKASVTGSSRFESAASASPSPECEGDGNGDGDGADVGEDRARRRQRAKSNARGKERQREEWRHTHANPLADNSSLRLDVATSRGEHGKDDEHDPPSTPKKRIPTRARDQSRLLRFSQLMSDVEASGDSLLDLSRIRFGDGDCDGDDGSEYEFGEEGRARLHDGEMGKRPTSVSVEEGGAQGRNKSVRVRTGVI